MKTKNKNLSNMIYMTEQKNLEQEMQSSILSSNAASTVTQTASFQGNTASQSHVFLPKIITNNSPANKYVPLSAYSAPTHYTNYIDTLAEKHRIDAILKNEEKINKEEEIRNAVANSIYWHGKNYIADVPTFGPQQIKNFLVACPPILHPLIAQTHFSAVSALLAWCVIAAIASSNKVKIKCYEHWSEVTSILTVISAFSGTRKSAFTERLRKPIVEFLKTKNKTAITDESQKKIVKKILKKLEKDALNRACEEFKSYKSSKEKGEFLKSFAQTNNEEFELFLEEYGILIDSFTKTGLFTHLESNAEQGGIITPEADALISLFFSKNNDPSFFNKLHNQEPYTYVTGNKSYAFSNPTLSMLALIQPNIARKLYSHENLRETGASARILPYFDPRNEISYSTVNDRKYEELLIQKTIKIFNLYHNTDSNTKYTATLTKEAYYVVKNFESELKYSFIPQTHIHSHATLRKLHGYAVRFAWAIHLLLTDSFHEMPIGIQSMEMAIDLCRVLLPHIEYAYDPAGLQAEETAIKIFEYFKNIDLKIDTLAYGYTDSRTIQLSIHRNAKQVAHALTLLKRFGYVDVIRVGSSKNIIVPHPLLLGGQKKISLGGYPPKVNF